jgi:hypothetical protein
MTAVYFICVHFAVGRGLARREHRRAFGRGPFSTRRNFLATHIRHRLSFRSLPRHQRPLMLDVVLSALLAPLMPGIREASSRGLLELATDVLAVALASVVRTTDDKLLPAVAAGQREDNELVHPSRMGENWTATSETTTVSAYWRVHPPLVHRGLRWRPGPSLFPSDGQNYRNRPHGTATS